jgi:hypothetical protein
VAVGLVLDDPLRVRCKVRLGSASSRESSGISVRKARLPRRLIALRGQFSLAFPEPGYAVAMSWRRSSVKR